jgi:hypothetical protein
MFCWLCIIVYQYSETNVIHFLFNLLSINSLYMFPALLAQPQEALHKQHLVYCLRVMSVDWISRKTEKVLILQLLARQEWFAHVTTTATDITTTTTATATAAATTTTTTTTTTSNVC